MFPDDLLTVESSAPTLRAALERLRHRHSLLRDALARIGEHSACNQETASEAISTARLALAAEERLPKGE